MITDTRYWELSQQLDTEQARPLSFKLKAYTFLVDPQQARDIGKARQKIHAQNSTRRFYDDTDLEDTIGVMGEAAFATYSGLNMDMGLYEHGDGHTDFSTKIHGQQITIDVKTYRKPIHILIKDFNAKHAADILVLAALEGADLIRLLGWEHKLCVLCSTPRDFGFGIKNYYRHRNAIRPMWQLDDLLKGKP